MGALSLVWYICEKIKKYSLKAVFIKSIVSALFIAVAACGYYCSLRNGSASTLGIFVITGLLFGLLGDIWLDLKYVFPEKDGAFTYAGFAVFAVGHLLYIAGIIINYFVPDASGKALYIIVPALLALAVSTGNILLEKPMKLRFGKMKPTVFAYGAILFCTLLISGSLAYMNGWQDRTLDLICIGAALFAVSDLVLSGTYFGVEKKERPIDFILNYLTYYGGQFIIAYSLLFLK